MRNRSRIDWRVRHLCTMVVGPEEGAATTTEEERKSADEDSYGTFRC